MSAVTIPTADPDDTLAVLEAARAWLSDPEHWTTGAYWCGVRGAVQTRRCVRRTCGVGALALVAGSAQAFRFPAWAEWALRAAALALFGVGAVDVNDQHGHAAILAAYDKAIATERERRGQAAND